MLPYGVYGHKRCDSNWKNEIFKCILQNDWYYEYFLGNRSHVNATERIDEIVNIGSGKGLVLSGNKPLPEPMLAKFCDAIWHNLATMG